MAYGIDDTIQQKVDAYRGNPGALQRRYTQNRELIDLLALQKLKSEKDAAARDMQMKMQQQPQTIAQQYEAELAGRTKDEMLQGVAGVMQQRQAQQQRNMQRVANAPRMAQGGIVGFAQGDRVSRQRRELDPTLRSHYAKRTMAASAPASIIIETPTFAWDEPLVNTLVKSGGRCNGRACPKS